MKSEPASEVEGRLAALERKLEEFALELRRLDKRVASLSSAVPEPESEPVSIAGEPALSTLIPKQGAVLNVLTQIGRSCLVLGGAFLIRSLTDSGTLPLVAGAGLGLVYAIAWILLAGRAAGRGQASSGAFLGITAVVIAYPLIAETTTRFKVFAPAGAAAVLVALTALCLGVAWRGDLPLLAWAALFGAAGVAFTLSLVTGAIEPFAAALLVIGVAAAWLAYGRRQWLGPRWIAAAAADFLMLWAALRLAPGSQPGVEPEVSSSLFLLLAFALPFLYMGTFALRTLARRQDVAVFDVVQTIAALAIGLGGAALVVRHVQDAQPTLGASAVGIAAGCYGIAFVFVARQGRRRNFLFYSTLALLLTLCGSALMAGGPALGILWCVLALAAASLAARFERLTLAFHSAVYCLAAAWQAGLFAASSDAFLAAPAAPWASFSAPALGVLAASLACLLLLARVKEESRRAGWRLPRLALSVIVAFGAGGLAVAGLRGLAGANAPALAALRTAVLASAALPLAALRRRAGLPELAWLSYAVLIITAGKLLFEDLPGGRPGPLFIAFVFFGGALLVVPRLLRRAAS